MIIACKQICSNCKKIQNITFHLLQTAGLEKFAQLLVWYAGINMLDGYKVHAVPHWFILASQFMKLR